MKTARVDRLLVQRGFYDSRQKAQAALMAGEVSVQGNKILKPGTMIPEDAIIGIAKKDPYVSRGAHKLLKALEVFPIDVRGKVCMDVGASTGGFTQVMLEAGAKKVYSVDVGYGQLDYRLRTDSRVVVLERQNIRHLKSEQITEALDFFTVDVSFISIRLFLRHLRSFLKEGAEGVILIKPQFEAGRDEVGKGVITDPALHLKILQRMLNFFREENFQVLGLDFSPIKGPKGNREFLLHCRNADWQEKDFQESIILRRAHEEL